ncbi:glucose-1-phosphate cytidylyltransferase [Eubacterium xylanophilum]|uniref:glucose-1-phosphate cytidylyltransferase n=1 Tax=Eubacterium xylanophilum TaxID=39497 RepID=UPI0004798DB0|nr:glucose-1-phosphate cytidylyltransferase [Eubacterium xylanophilum]MCR5797378.1 glucose-1-phosphate cytidylyltransferase [Eubacterium sp.]
MKAVLLAGGFGTRISEESVLKPKPMIEIGEKPILWHIMKVFSHYGINEFIICAGYKQHVIKEWFADYYLHNSDITFDYTKGGEMVVHNNIAEPWKVTIVDTGLKTMTGGRVKRIKKYVGDETFLLTYGDGISNININDLIDFHKKHGKIATMSSYNVGQQFGVLDVREDDIVTAFREKSNDDGGLINIGFLVLEPQIFDYIDGDDTVFEKAPLERLASESQLVARKHQGFWQCMDTQRDRMKLEEMWESGNAPWKLWK